MRKILVGLAAASLAACGSPSLNNVSANATAPTNSAAPTPAPIAPENIVLPADEGDAAGSGNSSAGRDVGGDRAALLASCTQEAGAALPQGTDVARLCGCAVDRALAGANRGDAMRQCAADQNVQLPMPH